MALGNSRPRNWGKDFQMIALHDVLKRRRVAYQIKKSGKLLELWLTPSHNGVTLPFVQSFARLVNVRRGFWRAESIEDGGILATGVSERDIVRATIQGIWN
jgi:hypothetical protein